MSSLSVSCVSFSGNYEVLAKTIESLVESCLVAKKSGLLQEVELYLIDNGPDSKNLLLLKSVRDNNIYKFDKIEVITGQGNVGYGMANNLAVLKSHSEFHLVLNPDVIISTEAIQLSIEYLILNPNVGLIAPDAFEPNGVRQYLAKRNPEILVLAARALNLKLINQLIESKLHRYEYRDKIPRETPLNIDLASGCFMFCRTIELKKIGGFNAAYFMYFEDYDLCRRLRVNAEIHFVPCVKILHAGGGAARKGLRHIMYFVSSMIKFVAFNFKKKYRDKFCEIKN